MAFNRYDLRVSALLCWKWNRHLYQHILARLSCTKTHWIASRSRQWWGLQAPMHMWYWRRRRQQFGRCLMGELQGMGMTIWPSVTLDMLALTHAKSFAHRGLRMGSTPQLVSACQYNKMNDLEGCQYSMYSDSTTQAGIYHNQGCVNVHSIQHSYWIMVPHDLYWAQIAFLWIFKGMKMNFHFHFH